MVFPNSLDSGPSYDILGLADVADSISQSIARSSLFLRLVMAVSAPISYVYVEFLHKIEIGIL